MKLHEYFIFKWQQLYLPPLYYSLYLSTGRGTGDGVREGESGFGSAGGDEADSLSISSRVTTDIVSFNRRILRRSRLCRTSTLLRTHCILVKMVSNWMKNQYRNEHDLTRF